jgi:hypothetical protein
LYFAIYLQNTELATKALINFAKIPKKYYQEILPDVESYLEDCAELGFAEWMKGATQIMIKHKLTGSLALPLMIKFVLLIDSLAHHFFPDKSTSDLLEDEFKAGIAKQIQRNISHINIMGTSLALIYTLSEIAAEGPKLVSKSLGKLVEEF